MMEYFIIVRELAAEKRGDIPLYNPKKDTTKLRIASKLTPRKYENLEKPSMIWFMMLTPFPIRVPFKSCCCCCWLYIP